MLDNKENELRIAAEGQKIVEDIKSNDGNIIISHVFACLESRLEVLMREDEYCQGIIDLVADLNAKLDLAERIARKTIGKLGHIS